VNKGFGAGAAGAKTTKARKVAAPESTAIIIRIIAVLLRSRMLNITLQLLEE
jgi:hypothetical protein